MSTENGEPRKVRRLGKAERRAQLIDAAAEAFLVAGFDGTSMEDVARVAGISRLIVYRNFESKADLYGSVLDSVLVELGRAFDPPYRPQGNVVATMLPVARANAAAFQLLWRHAVHEPAFRDRADFLRGRVHEGARTAFEMFITDPVRLEWAAWAGGAHLVDAICTWLDMGDPDRDDEAVEIIQGGLLALAAAWSDL